jgi:Flp pilus assembly protein TadD
MVNYYKMLELQPTAKEDEIKKAINKELRNWSKRTNDPRLERRQEAERQVKDLGDAEAILLEPAKRAEYDKQLRTAPTEERQVDDSDLAGKADLVQEGWQLLIAGNISDALYVATKATEKKGNDPEAWALLAQAKFRWGDVEDAIYEYKRAIKLKPNIAPYYFDLGSVYESAERWSDALQQYQRASQIEPSTTMYRAAIGILLLKNDLYKDSIEILEQCMQEEPDNKTYQWFLAIAYSESSYQHWTHVPEGAPIPAGYYATQLEHIEEAEAFIAKAEALQFDDDELSEHIQGVKENILSMRKRKFHGNWLVVIVGTLYFGLGILYYFSCLIPQYILNRRVIKGQGSGSADFIAEGASAGFGQMAFNFLLVIAVLPLMIPWNFMKNYVFSK